ncbi:hypothetical protein EYR40_005907 [Pleurotus pulmonarius]|nr:hypothetical protein EYR36_005709 [Pleurotus pulmonarius]KAF4602691.1 hypothetical protein EYR40_005907 [Pleurotus pulmonarius]
MIPNHSPSTPKPNTLPLYRGVGNIFPPHISNLTAATPFHGINSEHDGPALPFPAQIDDQWSQVTGGGIILYDHESITAAIPSNRTKPDYGNEDGILPRESYTPKAYPTWMAAEPGQVTMNNVMAQDSGNAALWDEGMYNVEFEVPSSGLGPHPVYSPWIASEMGQVAGQNHSTGMAIAPMPSNGAMGPVGYGRPLFPSFSDPGQASQPAQGVLNAMVVRPVISTPAAALEAERRRIHPRKFSCKFCPAGFTSKANRDRHHRAHLGIKPFVCACGKAFTAKGDLLRHRRYKYKSCQAHIPLSASASSS